MTDPSSRPVLLVHGFTTSAERTWREPGWIDLLADAGRPVIAPICSGTATPPSPTGSRPTPMSSAWWPMSCPTARSTPSVYSAGAAIVLALAAEEPSRFANIVLAGVGRNLVEEREEGNAILDALEGRGDPDNLVSQHFKMLAETDGNDPVALAAFIKRKRPRLTADELARVTMPTLVVIGDQDFAGPGEPLVEALPNAELVTLPRIDHFGLPKAFPFLERALRFVGADPMG